MTTQVEIHYVNNLLISDTGFRKELAKVVNELVQVVEPDPEIHLIRKMNGEILEIARQFSWNGGSFTVIWFKYIDEVVVHPNFL